MAKLMITTQVLENYGSEEQPFWKAKGGSDYVVRNFTDFNRVNAVVAQLRADIEIDNAFCSEYIVSWSVEDDDYLTEFEQSQLDYEGRIDFPATELELGTVA